MALFVPGIATRRTRLSVTLGLVLLAALLAAGCGSTTTKLPTGRLTLQLSEYRIRPQRVSVPAGQVMIVAHNAGILTHNLAVESVHRDASGNPNVLGHTATLLPGQTSAPLQVTLAPGQYNLVSTLANQEDLGMYSVLVVRPA